MGDGIDECYNDACGCQRFIRETGVSLGVIWAAVYPNVGYISILARDTILVAARYLQFDPIMSLGDDMYRHWMLDVPGLSSL